MCSSDLDSIIASVATSPGTYDWPSGVVDSEYGGSWARDFSVGFSITDMGTDVPVGGISTTLMTSAQNAFDYQFLAGSEAVYLEFIFSLSDPSKTITLNYPEFLTPTDPGIIIPETPTTSILVFPNGPGVRYGTMSYWNYIMNSFSDPPLVDAFGQMPTVLDWLCWKRIALEGIAATSGLDTEIANLYTSTEGNTRAALSVGTESFVVMASPSSDGTVNNAITGILVNTYAEAPPICQTPLKARDKSFQPTGAYAQEAWSHAQWGRYYVSIPKADIADPSGTIVSSPWIPGVPGWPIQRQAIPSNGSENLSTWTIVSHGEVFADFNPWHGTFSILFPGGAERYPWLLCTDEGEMHNAYCKLNDSGTFDIWYRWSSLNVPKWNHDKRVTFTGGWSWPKMARDYTTRIYLTATYTNQGGSDPLSSGVYQIYSDDEGQTWSPQSGGVLAPVFLG